MSELITLADRLAALRKTHATETQAPSTQEGRVRTHELALLTALIDAVQSLQNDATAMREALLAPAQTTAGDQP